MALTAEQIRASFEAKKKLLSGGVEADTQGERQTPSRSLSAHLDSGSSAPPAQNTLPAPVLAEVPVSASTHVDAGDQARDSTQPLPNVEQGSVEKPLTPAQSRGGHPYEKTTEANPNDTSKRQALRAISHDKLGNQETKPETVESYTEKLGKIGAENSGAKGLNKEADNLPSLPETDRTEAAPRTPPRSHKSAGSGVGLPKLPSATVKSSTRNVDPKVPQAPEIEVAVLASLYQYPATCFPIFNERARADFFFSPVNRSFFERLSDYFTEHGQADPQSFLQSLLDSGQLEKHGGSFFLSSLLAAVSPPSALEYHLDILRDKYVQRSLYQAAAELARKAVAVPQEDDLSSLVLEHQALIADLTTDLAARNGHLSLRRVSEIFGMTFDDTDNYFGDRVIAAGQPCTLLGPGDIGKSRLSIQLALSMITGRDFLGMPTHAPNKTWLFIQSENSCRRLYADLKNMLSGLGLSESERAQVEEHLLIHTLENDYDSFLSLEDDKIYAKVNDLIQKVKPDVIDWDPLNSLTDEDLNADVDMRKVCMKISHVTKQGDISRVPFVVHHALTGKTGAAKAVGWEKSSYGRNSKVLHAWTRAQINLAPRSPDDSTLLIMSCGKNNNGKAFPEVGVIFDEDQGIYLLDTNFDPAAFREEVGIASTKTSLTPQMILALHWNADVLDKKSLVKTITDEFGCGKTRAYELVDQAKKRGIVKFSPITRLYSKR